MPYRLSEDCVHIKHQRAIWNTRPQPQAARTHDYLTHHGILVHSDPVMQIMPTDDAGNHTWNRLHDYDALILTSEAALRVLQNHKPHFDGCIYTTGEGLAQQVRDAGYPHVIAGKGTAASIPSMITHHHLLYLRGEEVAQNMRSLLLNKMLDEWIVYSAHPSPALAPQTITLLQQDALAYVLCTSARCADALMHLVEQAGLTAQLATCTALCFSEAIAQRLDASLWGEIQICTAASDEALMKIIQCDALL